MMTTEQYIEIISNWFESNCDGDWEHENQIIIQTTSNPGWLLTVDFAKTTLEPLRLEESYEVSESDWFFYTIDDGKFSGAGDLKKLPTLLQSLAKILDVHSGV